MVYIRKQPVHQAHSTCPKCNIPMEDYDDLVLNCPTENCTFISLKQKFALGDTPIWWYSCQTCQQTYPTLEEGICTVCDSEMQQRWDALIGQV